MELLILLAVVLLLFGAKRLPQLSRSLGSGIREFRKGISAVGDVEEAQDRKENPSLDGVPHGGLSRAQDEEMTRAGQQS